MKQYVALLSGNEVMTVRGENVWEVIVQVAQSHSHPPLALLEQAPDGGKWYAWLPNMLLVIVPPPPERVEVEEWAIYPITSDPITLAQGMSPVRGTFDQVVSLVEAISEKGGEA